MILFLFISGIQFLGFGTAFNADFGVTAGTLGPGTTFSGSIINGLSWGPGFGWMALMIAIGPAIGTFIVGVLGMNEY